jgi:hypothetical protein
MDSPLNIPGNGITIIPDELPTSVEVRTGALFPKLDYLRKLGMEVTKIELADKGFRISAKPKK